MLSKVKFVPRAYPRTPVGGAAGPIRARSEVRRLLCQTVRALLEWGHALRCQWITPFGVASLCLAFGLLAGCWLHVI